MEVAVPPPPTQVLRRRPGRCEVLVTVLSADAGVLRCSKCRSGAHAVLPAVAGVCSGRAERVGVRADVLPAVAGGRCRPPSGLGAMLAE